jgi:hypothetical protein
MRKQSSVNTNPNNKNKNKTETTPKTKRLPANELHTLGMNLLRVLTTATITDINTVTSSACKVLRSNKKNYSDAMRRAKDPNHHPGGLNKS